MQATDMFSLEAHDGPYESWPTRTRLRCDGRPTSTRLPGYVLEAQYRCGDRYLLITTWDCPWEEENELLLLDSSRLRVVSRRTVGPTAAILICNSLPLDARRLRLVACGSAGPDLVVTVRERRPYLLGPLLTWSLEPRA